MVHLAPVVTQQAVAVAGLLLLALMPLAKMVGTAATVQHQA
jgi:hypothetical protein